MPTPGEEDEVSDGKDEAETALAAPLASSTGAASPAPALIAAPLGGASPPVRLLCLPQLRQPERNTIVIVITLVSN